MREGLERADALIVIVGKDWAASLWTQQEFHLALEARKPVIPLLLPDMPWGDLPPELRLRRCFKLDEGREERGLIDFVKQLPESFVPESRKQEAPAANIDDPQKGRWGGESKRDGRQLTAGVADQGNGWFLVGLAVACVDGPPLVGEVEFHLHPSFHPSIVRVPVRDDHAVLKFPAWGAFTVGASADEGRTRLELDLAQTADAPELFRSR